MDQVRKSLLEAGSGNARIKEERNDFKPNALKIPPQKASEVSKANLK